MSPFSFPVTFMPCDVAGEIEKVEIPPSMSLSDDDAEPPTRVEALGAGLVIHHLL